MLFYNLFQKYAPAIDSNQVLSKDELLKHVEACDRWLMMQLPFTVVRKINGLVRYE
jgi:hypothetical protein